ncbi:Dynein beta chain ciliary [Fasciola gigantica]|uniref:Dynein beta chain ciliary n=1 Tax=Fasciola gigantica TaxID=46835 RepID=A0A504YLU8_FASGI|nr:Dynein beta chain ciliary [Fasciola gigantica]
MKQYAHLPPPTPIYLNTQTSKITRSLVYAIESLVIAWSHQIHKALLKDSAQPLLDGLNPNPLIELDFWKAKAINLENIFDQLNSPKARQMAQILEGANSSYFIPFKEMFKSVVVALREAQDIHNHLSTLRPYLEDMEQAELEQLRMHFEPVMHLLCLVWASSPGYRQPSRILIILQELFYFTPAKILGYISRRVNTTLNASNYRESSFFAFQCRAHLDPTEVLKAEPEEAICKVNLTLDILHAFKSCYEDHRARLGEYFDKMKNEHGQPIEPVLWEFKTELAFGRYDAFTERVQFVQHLMNTSLEFLKLEKVVFGGLAGNSLNIRLKEIIDLYVEKYKMFSDRTYDVLDPMNDEFAADFQNFESHVKDLDFRLASIICQAMEECPSSEHLLKLLALLISFMERPVIKEVCEPKYKLLIQMIDTEMDTAKRIYDHHVATPHVVVRKGESAAKSGGSKKSDDSGMDSDENTPGSRKSALDQNSNKVSIYGHVHKNMPRIAGNLKWASELTQRISGPVDLIDQLDLPYQVAVFNEWAKGVDSVCSFNLSQPLLVRDPTTNMLQVNFDAKTNRELFKAELDSSSWDRYVLFVDSIVQEGLAANLECSLRYLLNETENLPTIAALFEAQMELQEKMIEDTRLATLRDQLMDRVQEVVKQAVSYQASFESYSYLWIDDRQECMNQFLTYGQVLTAEDLDLLAAGPVAPIVTPDGEEQGTTGLVPKAPTLEQFKQQIDHYEKIYAEVDRFDGSTKFQSWFRVDARKFKQALINEIKRWSLMFKQHLIEHVTNSLTELNAFIQVTNASLGITLQEGDYDGLVHVMQHLGNVKDRQEATDGMFEPLKQTIELLKTYDQEMPEEVHQLLENNNALAAMEREMQSLSTSAGLFEVNVPEFKQIKQCRKELRLLKFLWDYIYSILHSITYWTYSPWRTVNVDQLDLDCKKFAKDLRALDKEMRSWDAYLGIEDKVKNMLTSLRSVGELQNPAIRDRHWIQLMNATGVRFQMHEGTTLMDLLSLNLHEYEEEVRNLVDKAVKEMSMEKVLNELNNTWKLMQFEPEPHPRTGMKLLKVSEELIEVLEENQVQLQNMMTSKFIAHFLEEVSTWQKKLSVADQVITIGMEVQRTWCYLESIFIGSEDIRKQLPGDTARFDGIDHDFKALMEEVGKDLNVIRATSIPHLYERFEALQHSLTLCEKALAEYLETKRLAFPRFYFVSPTDLLDILSNGNIPEQVAKHLTKLFDSLATLQFRKKSDGKTNTKVAHQMGAKDGEEVNLSKDTDLDGQVEVWLNRLLDEMRATVRHYLADAVTTYEDKARDQWLFEYPAQVALAGSQIGWTTEVNINFARLEEGYENALKDYNKKQIGQLNALIALLIGELSAQDRQKVMTICTIDVHNRDVVGKLISQKIDNSQSFTWISQLRHRWDERQKDCFVNICDAQFRYAHEYLGNTPRLVITPLTDRCYITLTQSLHLTMSGAPAGPAGTGKTETTKDLGRALGIMVYVFNCSEQMDYKSIGNIYKGLAQSGAWGCFDEFNRISVEVLSVVAVQVKCIQDAIRDRKKRFNFLGEEISLDPTVGLFITMNPGYAGRAELPENLKALFRPCAMVVPDFELICEIMLVAEGFLEARLLARKFITLYNLNKELLSRQDHYDWGLRAIKSVLVVAGALKRSDPGRPEDQVLMRALRDFNTPKIVTDDLPVFMGLIGDLFPALDVPRKRDLEFEKQVRQAALDLKLQPEENFILKAVQLQELFAVRHSVFVLGNAGTGKSMVWKTLYRTNVNLKKRPVAIDLDPKTVTNDELFGIINPATREWKDGLFSVVMRDMANLTHDGPKWIVLDGDIDPMWIESLNTVMDDNKVLTLASNERIPLTPTMRLLFEISHLKTATPATVSRAGILYVNPQDLGTTPFVSSWVAAREIQSEQANLTILFDKYVGPCLEGLRTRFKKITPIVEIAHVQMLCYLLDCHLIPTNTPPDCPKELYELYFVFCAVWAFGGALFQDQLVDHRVEFSKWWSTEFKTIKFPSQGTVFDYYIDSETKKFEPWSRRMPTFELDSELPLQATLVPTMETVRIRYFLDRLLEARRPVMLVGNAGTGKTVLVQDTFSGFTEDTMVSNVPFNFYTTSEMLQRILEKPLEKKAGRNYGPPGNKRLVYFIDDMNMPEVDTYFTVQPHCLIRQHIDHSHWYDRTKLTLKEIHNTQYVACMNPTSGSFTIDSRLQGLLFASADCLKQPLDLVRLWMHESSRVYADKMVDREDVETFDRLLRETTKKHFEDMNEEQLFQTPNMYCHFTQGIGEPKYMPLEHIPDIVRVLNDALDNYNELNAVMNLVLFEDAIAHILRINRILESPRGNALLVGVGGSGKQSLSRLSAFISSLEVFQITLRKGYAIPDLRADLAGLYLKAGLKNTGTVFLLTDAQVADEKFLVLVNDLLASGEIPDLLPDDEVENVINGMRGEVKSQGLPDTRENCWAYFIDKVRRLLKVILCFSPVGSTLRVRARKFPAVVNCTSIDWFHEWPQDALLSVSQRFLSNITLLPEELRPSVSKFMSSVHQSVNEMSVLYLQNERRHNYTTPKSFLEQIQLYGNMLRDKHADLMGKMNRLENGLQKLESTAQQVDDLKAKLAAQEVELAQKNEDANKLLAIVGAETEKVSGEKEFANQEEQKVAVIKAEVAKKQRDCEIDLAKAEPALLAAQDALNTLNKNNLTEMKSFGSPPPAVVNVTAAVMVLLAPGGKVPRDRSWKAAKAGIMGKVDLFLDNLINYDKENIHENCLKAIQEYLKDPEFDPDFIRSKSTAAAGLCSWVINIVTFYNIYCDVKPKRDALDAANEELRQATEKLESIQKKIQELEATLNELTNKFEIATREKQRCQDEADATFKTIELANRLVGGLASEKIRWAEQVEQYKKQAVTLPGDVLLTSAFLSYVGCFTKRYRTTLIDQYWIPALKTLQPSIPITADLDPLQMLVDDAIVATWNNEGLPSDRMSIENATILTNTERWPLIIDPQLQGVKWIKTRYDTALRVVRLGQKGYLDRIEQAISAGDTVLLENIEETVDPVLDPLLGRMTIKKGRAIRLGDKEVEYSPQFRLILQTKLANPHYKPEMQAQTTLINFTVTRDGLEDQLLASVVSKERPDLEQLKADLTRQQNEFKITLKSLEDSLLARLSAAEGNFLGDYALVENLEKNKRTAIEIGEQVEKAKVTEVKINEARELYRPAAARASLLYFILNDLSKINPIYQFSLKAFRSVFEVAIDRTEAAEEVRDRVKNLIESITFSVYTYTSRGLFEKDKLIFTAQMAFQILIMNKEIDSTELDFLLRFPIVPNVTSPVDFLTNNGWGGIKALSNMEAFRNLDKDIEGSAKRWKKFVDGECPEKEKLPQGWKSKAALQRLCIMRALRPDRMTYAVTDFVAEKLGQKYVEGSGMPFATSFEESGPAIPIFFILSPGVDPLKDVESLGKKLGFTGDQGNFHSVSLGQGQEVVAEKAMELASSQGHWVVLQNIHLVAKWLTTLEKRMEEYAESGHKNYRLFISAEPASSPEYHIIPQGILENAIKITNEPPTGMFANLHKALNNFSQETLEMCSRENEFKTILFGLCYFHAVICERRKFGPQGWNRGYPFNTGDLTISVNVLYNYLEANSKVPWEDLRYLFGDIMYGGHITDDWDRRLCKTYLEEYLVPEMLDGDHLLAPGFRVPQNTDYKGYHQYIDDSLPAESPYLYGLHPNAEMEFLTNASEKLFRTVFEMQPRDSAGGGGGGGGRDEKLQSTLDEIVEKLPEEFNMTELQAKVPPEERTPYVVVAFQECERMNMLIREMRRSLKELSLGLKGELTTTPEMEALSNALVLDSVPDSWIKRAYPSLFPLGIWYADMLVRVKELDNWTNDFALPNSVWIGGLFNPQSFLTAIMQQTARKNEWPLDRMVLQCDVTKKTRDEMSSPPREGAYIHGLYMEGARWDIQTGMIAEARLKELAPIMPVIFLKAIPVDRQDLRNTYACPVYKTKQRGPTYVWTFNMKTKEKSARWVLGGVALLLQV